MRSLLLLLGGVSACVLLGIGSILKMQTVSDLNDKELIVVVHAKLHGFTTSRAILEESLDSRVGDLDQMDQSVTSLIRDLKNADCPNAKSRRALLLEENILERVRELVVFRKSCEQSLHSATSDPLRENPLAGGIELQANQMPSAEGKSETVDQSVIAKRMEELKQQNAQVRSLIIPAGGIFLQQVHEDAGRRPVTGSNPKFSVISINWMDCWQRPCCEFL